MCGLQPVSRKPEFDLKGLTARIDELLVQMERDGIIVVPMITRLKAGTLKARQWPSSCRSTITKPLAGVRDVLFVSTLQFLSCGTSGMH